MKSNRAQFLDHCEDCRYSQALELLDQGVDVNSIGKDRITGLQLAARQGGTAFVIALLERGADIGARDKFDWTALHFAARYGHDDLCQELLDRGADVNWRTEHLETALHLAARLGNTSGCLGLIGRGAEIEAKTVEGWTALGFAVMTVADQACLALVANGADMAACKTDVARDKKTNDLYLRLGRLSPLEAGAELGIGSVISKLLQDDTDPTTLVGRCAKAIELAEEQGKREGPTFLRAWLASQTAMQAIAEISGARGCAP